MKISRKNDLKVILDLNTYKIKSKKSIRLLEIEFDLGLE